MAERISASLCPGIMDSYDTTAEPPKYTVRHMDGVEPVGVSITEGQYGEIEINCLFLGARNICRRYGETLDPDQASFIGPTCKFVPQAQYLSADVYEYPFDIPSIYQKTWDQLSLEAKTASSHASGYTFAGMERDAFLGMCQVFKIGDNGEDVINELAELGVIEEWSKLDAVRNALRQLDTGTVEDMEVAAKESTQLRVRQNLESELQEYQNVISPEFRAEHAGKEWVDTYIQGMRDVWETPRTHITFSPGFQTFVDQFRDYGFPINFMKERR